MAGQLSADAGSLQPARFRAFNAELERGRAIEGGHPRATSPTPSPATSVFAPNDKGMRIVKDEDPLDYRRRQVLTARNVRGGWLTDLLMAGLNLQIEHHLFPSVPSVHLRKAQCLVGATATNWT